jgi:hypothetical protein
MDQYGNELAPYPHRVDLKLPVDKQALEERIAHIHEWFNASKTKAFGGPPVILDHMGFTHYTAWFEDPAEAILFKLACNGTK